MKVLLLVLSLLCVGRLVASNALQIGFMEGTVGSEISIPILHVGTDAVAGANVDFRFDPTKMELLEVLPGAAAPDWTLDSEQTVANEVRLLITHPTGNALPEGEIARVKVRLLETFAHSEATGAALVRRDTSNPVASLIDCHWLPLLEITSPAEGAGLVNSAPNHIQFRVSPGEHLLTSLDLLLQERTVLSSSSAEDRSFSWQPNLTAGGLLNLSVQATDELALSSVSDPVQVLINTPPILAAIADKTVNELAHLTFTAVATDADLPANTLTYSLIEAPTGAGIDASTGEFSWTPTEAQGPGTFNFTVRVSDGTATTDQPVKVTVSEVNIAPVLAAITDKTVNELAPLTFTVAATDADLPANTLTYSLIGAPTGAGIGTSTGAFSWTPTEAQGPGTFNFTVRVSDGTATTDQPVKVTVSEVNIAPVLAAITEKTVNELAPLTFTAAATDADLPANTLTYSLIGAPTGAGIGASTGAFSWTPTETQGPGTFNFTVRVSDGTATTDQPVKVTVSEVNIAPVLAAITDKTVNELTPLTFTVAATDVDLPANTLTYSLIGAPSGAGISASTGVFSCTPTEAQGPGTFNFTVRVSDGTATTDQPVKVTVSEVNIAPVLAAITDKTVNELAPLTFTAAATDADLPANTLTYSLIGAPTGAGIGASTGVFSWTPTEAQGPGTFNFTVRVSDGTTTTDQPVKVTVSEVNVAPALAAITDKTVNELSPLTFTAAATDADLPANTLIYSLIGAPTGAGIIANTGAFSWTPTEAQGPGTFNFTVRVSDGTATTDQPVKVTVSEVNVAPALAAITDKAVNELAPLTFTAAATDADLPANTLTYSLIGAPTGAGISASTGVFSWTPTEAQGPGTFNFTVRVSDGTSTADQPVKVTVSEVNVSPVLAAITDKAVNELAALTFTAAATDADLPANTLTYSLIGAPTGAGISASTGVFSWTPTEDQGPGTFNFTVRVSDGTSTADQPVKVTVSEVNVSPVLAAITDKAVNELAALTFTAAATDADLPANTLTYSLIGAPTGAGISASTGVFSWTPTEAQGPGTFNFSVRVSDGTATMDQPVKVTVNEVNVAPVLAAIKDKAVDELAALTFTATATDADLPVNTLTYSLIGAPTGAGISASTGAFSWIPTEAQGPGTFNFTVRVSDGTTTTDQPVKVTVSEVNAAPVLAAIPDQSVNELAPLTFTAAASDEDLPASTLTYSLVGAPAGAAIHPSSGAFSWTPNGSQGPGLYSLSVRVSDGNLIDEQLVMVTVLDITPPLLTLPPNRVAEATGPTGATVVFAVSAWDRVDGDVVATASPASGSIFPLGMTTVNVVSRDVVGNVRNGSFTVEVKDTTAPTLTLPSTQVLAVRGNTGTVVSFEVSAIDLVDGAVTATATPPSGSLFPTGIHTVNVSSTDLAGNAAHGNFRVVVVNTEQLLSNPNITPAGGSAPATISGEIRGGPPGWSVILQASCDLGKTDAWEDIGTISLDESGNADFGPISDPHSIGLETDFFRVKLAP
jgi:hypothetical protein